MPGVNILTLVKGSIDERVRPFPSIFAGHTIFNHLEFKIVTWIPLQIRPAERRDAERAYVKMVLVEEGKTWASLDQEGRRCM